MIIKKFLSLKKINMQREKKNEKAHKTANLPLHITSKSDLKLIKKKSK